jgi:alcohol dehydrogenase (NADP+)
MPPPQSRDTRGLLISSSVLRVCPSQNIAFSQLTDVDDNKMPLEAYLTLLKPGGHFVLVGVPESKLPAISPAVLIMSNTHLAGSLIGAPHEIEEVLEFAAKHKVKAWTTKYSLNDVNTAVKSMHAGEARYRYVLVNEKNGGKM